MPHVARGGDYVLSTHTHNWCFTRGVIAEGHFAPWVSLRLILDGVHRPKKPGKRRR